METRIAEQTTEFENELENLKQQHAKHIQQICETFSNKIEKINEEKLSLASDYNKELNVTQLAINEVRDENLRATLQLESKLHEKTIVEFKKSATVKLKMDEMKEVHGKLLRKSAGSLRDIVSAMESEFKQNLDERYKEKQVLMNQIKVLKLELTEYSKHLAIDNERCIVGIKMQYGQQLKQGNEMILKWRAENSVLCRKVEAIQTLCIKFEKEKYILHSELDQVRKLIPHYEQHIAELKQELNVRDTTLLKKEARLSKAYDENLKLESQIIQLNKRVAEIRIQTEPLETQINQKNDYIIHLNSQLNELKQTESALKSRNDKLTNKCYAQSLEIGAQNTRYATQQTLINRICHDIYIMTHDIQNTAKLKEHALQLNQK